MSGRVRYVMMMSVDPAYFDDTEEEGIKITETFTDLGGFERWLHDELCEKNDIISGEFIGIFSAKKEFRGLIRVPARFRRNNLTGVVFPAAEHAFTEKEEGLIRGTIVSHNHPSDFPFVYDEILWARDLNVIESRIVTADWIYSVRPRAAGWPSWETIGRANAEIDSELSVHNCVARSHSDPAWLHGRYEQLSRRAGFEYSREKYLPDKAGVLAVAGEKQPT
jgi:hypothetical protein